MNTQLIEQALELADTQQLAIFPVGADKRPIIKGWRTKATTDPDEIRRLFGLQGAAGIGVPCGVDNDIICFDVDFGHDPGPERTAILQSWVTQWGAHIEQNAMVRETRSGGLHIIYGHYPGAQSPRRIMPKLDVIKEGFYFVWWMDDHSYRHIAGELGFEGPPAPMLMVIERGQGSDGSALMSSDEAHEAMMSDGDDGMRHDALLRMTQDWAAEHPAHTMSQWCDGFAEMFEDMYADRIDAERFNQLIEWRIDDHTGEPGGELGRAFAGVKPTLERSAAILSAAGDALRARGSLAPVMPLTQFAAEKVQAVFGEGLRASSGQIIVDDLLDRELNDIEWLIEDVLPRGNLIGLAGPSGAGKTRVLAALIAALASGNTDLIGLPKATGPVKTLYIANEERFEDIERRIKAAAKANGMTGSLPITVRGKDKGQLRLSGPEGMGDVVEELVKWIKDEGFELVIFDPFVTLGIDDENAASGVDAVMEALQYLTTTGAAVMFVHHSPKDRALPADEYRGDLAAFRGHGSIYSSLDIAMTLFPYLPPACHEKTAGRANRKKLAQAQRDRRVPRFIALDSTKERESEGFPSIYFRLDGQSVREGGKPIGAVVPVLESEAARTLEAVLNSMPDEAIDRAKHKVWAAVLLEAFPKSARLSLQQMVEVLDDLEPVGWERGKQRARSNEGRGKHLLDMLCQSLTINGVNVYVAQDGLKYIWTVDQL
jgi:hypothetical protein